MPRFRSGTVRPRRTRCASKRCTTSRTTATGGFAGNARRSDLTAQRLDPARLAAEQLWSAPLRAGDALPLRRRARLIRLEPEVHRVPRRTHRPPGQPSPPRQRTHPHQGQRLDPHRTGRRLRRGTCFTALPMSLRCRTALPRHRPQRRVAASWTPQHESHSLEEPAPGSIRGRNPWSSGSDCASLRPIGTLRRSIEVAPTGIDDCHRLGESIEAALAGFGRAVAVGAGSRMRIVSLDPSTSDPPGNHPVRSGRSANRRSRPWIGVSPM